MTRKDKKKQAELWKTAAWDMLYLVQCSINGLVPDLEHVAKMDLAKVYARSKSQSLEAMTYMALESLMEAQPSVKLSDETQVLPKWEEAKNKAIRKTMLMDAARAKLFAYMEEKGIWHVALKGAVLCHMYPEYGMRQMSDNDILFDPAFRQEVHDWFVEQGYEVENYGKSNHDEYLKKPIYNFEMHVDLFYKGVYPQFDQHYQGLKDRLLTMPGKHFEYRMTNEDFYLYTIAHEYKHCHYDGTGLRSLVDLYVFNKLKNEMDCKYLQEELEKMKLFVFEKNMRELAQKVFSSGKGINLLAEKEMFALKELLFGGTYGTLKNHCRREMIEIQGGGDIISRRVKLQYLMHQLFLNQEQMEKWCERYASYFLYHHWLMPVAPVWRILKIMIQKRKQIAAELDAVRRA